MCFILSGKRLQREEFQKIIRNLKGRCCRDSHKWSDEATHFIPPVQVRRTEKFFAAAASGRWILKMDYLTACNQAGKFVGPETGLNEEATISLDAPRKWRQLRERTSHGAFYGMQIVTYRKSFVPSLDTLECVMKAGGGAILATSPPYTKFLGSGIDFAVITQGMPRDDMWVLEFLNHKIPCVLVDYLVEYICRPDYARDDHVLYDTIEWADKSLANHETRIGMRVESKKNWANLEMEGMNSTDLICNNNKEEKQLPFNTSEVANKTPLEKGDGIHTRVCNYPRNYSEETTDKDDDEGALLRRVRAKYFQAKEEFYAKEKIYLAVEFFIRYIDVLNL